MDLILEDPPKDGRGGKRRPFGEITAWVEAVRSESGGQWAKFHRPTSPGSAAHLRTGHNFGASPGEFEVRTVSIPGDSRVWLYARLNPEATR